MVPLDCAMDRAMDRISDAQPMKRNFSMEKIFQASVPEVSRLLFGSRQLLQNALLGPSW